jgi:hypothetical protein
MLSKREIRGRLAPVEADAVAYEHDTHRVRYALLKSTGSLAVRVIPAGPATRRERSQGDGSDGDASNTPLVTCDTREYVIALAEITITGDETLAKHVLQLVAIVG